MDKIMKTMNWMKGLAFVSVMMMSVAGMAQRNGGNGMRQNNGAGMIVTEHGLTRGHGNDKINDNRGMDMRNDKGYNMGDVRNNDRRNEGNMRPDDRGMRHDDRNMRPDDRGMRYDRGPEPMMGGRGHVVDPYEGRVRHMSDGRWGYLRDNRWYYYDTYFEPDYYYSHPLRHFHSHRLGPVGKAIVATAVIGSLISILAH